MQVTSDRETDVVLIGAGIMSSTLGVLLKAFQTSLDLEAHALGIDRIDDDDS